MSALIPRVDSPKRDSWREQLAAVENWVAPAPSVTSLEDDVRMKEEFKYDASLEVGASEWIAAVLGEPLPTGVSFIETIRSGVILCRVVNAACRKRADKIDSPLLISKIHNSSIAFRCIENISNYTKACRSLGIAVEDSFDPTDLFQQKNMSLVMNQIYVLARWLHREGYDVPPISADRTSQSLWVSSLVEGDKAAASILQAPSTDQETLTDSQKELLDWANLQFKKANKNVTVTSYNDLRSGMVLIQLIQITTQAHIGPYVEEPQDLRDLMQNSSLVLRFLYAQTFIRPQCSGTHIIQGTPQHLEVLLSFIRDHFDLEYLFVKALKEDISDDFSDAPISAEIAADLLSHLEEDTHIEEIWEIEPDEPDVEDVEDVEDGDSETQPQSSSSEPCTSNTLIQSASDSHNHVASLNPPSPPFPPPPPPPHSLLNPTSVNEQDPKYQPPPRQFASRIFEEAAKNASLRLKAARKTAKEQQRLAAEEHERIAQEEARMLAEQTRLRLQIEAEETRLREEAEAIRLAQIQAEEALRRSTLEAEALEKQCLESLRLQEEENIKQAALEAERLRLLALEEEAALALRLQEEQRLLEEEANLKRAQAEAEQALLEAQRQIEALERQAQIAQQQREAEEQLRRQHEADELRQSEVEAAQQARQLSEQRAQQQEQVLLERRELEATIQSLQQDAVRSKDATACAQDLVDQFSQHLLPQSGSREEIQAQVDSCRQSLDQACKDLADLEVRIEKEAQDVDVLLGNLDAEESQIAARLSQAQQRVQSLEGGPTPRFGNHRLQNVLADARRAAQVIQEEASSHAMRAREIEMKESVQLHQLSEELANRKSTKASLDADYERLQNQLKEISQLEHAKEALELTRQDEKAIIAELVAAERSMQSHVQTHAHLFEDQRHAEITSPREIVASTRNNVPTDLEDQVAARLNELLLQAQVQQRHHQALMAQQQKVEQQRREEAEARAAEEERNRLEREQILAAEVRRKEAERLRQEIEAQRQLEMQKALEEQQRRFVAEQEELEQKKLELRLQLEEQERLLAAQLERDRLEQEARRQLEESHALRMSELQEQIVCIQSELAENLENADASSTDDTKKYAEYDHHHNENEDSSSPPSIPSTPSIISTSALWTAQRQPSSARLLQASQSQLKDFNTRERIRRAQAVVRKRVIEEAHQSENLFLQQLLGLQRNFAAPLSRIPEFTGEQIMIATADIEKLQQLHTNLLTALGSRLKTWDESSEIFEIFFQISPQFLKIYETYATNFVRNHATRKSLSKHKQYKSLAKKFKKESEGLSVAQVLELPFQRCVRYVRILQEMKKYTHATAAEAETLSEVISLFSNTVDHLCRCVVQAAPSESIGKKILKILAAGKSDLSIRRFLRTNENFPWKNFPVISCNIPTFPEIPMSLTFDDHASEERQILLFQHHIARLIELNREMMVAQNEVIHTIHAKISSAPLPAAMASADLMITVRLDPVVDVSVLVKPIDPVSHAISAVHARLNPLTHPELKAADSSQLCFKLIGERSYILDTSVPIHSILAVRNRFERGERMCFQLCFRPESFLVATDSQIDTPAEETVAEDPLSTSPSSPLIGRFFRAQTSRNPLARLQKTGSIMLPAFNKAPSALAMKLLSTTEQTPSSSSPPATTVTRHSRVVVEDALFKQSGSQTICTLLGLGPSELEMQAIPIDCIPISAINRSFEMRLLGLTNYTSCSLFEELSRVPNFAPQHRQLWLEVTMMHGAVQLAEPVRTLPAHLPLWSEWALFGIPFCSIPPEARLCVTLYLRYNPTARHAPNHVMVRGHKIRKGRSIPVAWVNLNLFGPFGFFMTGLCEYRMWDGGPASYFKTTSTPSDRLSPVLSLEFLGTQHPIVFQQSTAPSVFNQPSLRNHPALTSRKPTEDDYPLKKILMADPLYPLSTAEKKLLWKFRNYTCTNDPAALPKLLVAVDWTDPSQIQQIHELLLTWPLLPPLSALQLIDSKYMDCRVRQYAVKCLSHFSDNELCTFLLQIVQALKYEAHHSSALASFLILRAVRSPQLVGTALFWYIESEIRIPECERRWKLLKKALLLACGTEIGSSGHEFLQGAAMMRQIQSIAEKTKTVRDPKQRLEFLHSTLRDIVFNSTVMPINSRLEATGIFVDKCKVMQSFTLPLWLEFQNADPMGDPIRCIFKVGDDLRQDILTIQIMQIMDQLWEDNDLDLYLSAYSCVSTGSKVGMIEVVMNAHTTASIYRSEGGGALGSLQEDVLSLWLKRQNPAPDDYARAVRRFTRSCAGYSVASYVLGLGDRHNDNIMVRTDGSLFHIDFAHFLGNFLKFAGLARETTPFVLTPDFVYVMGGLNSPNFLEFVDLCCRAFLVVRRHAHLLMTIFSMMLSSGLTQLTSPKDILFLRSSLMLDLTDEQASIMFVKLIKKSCNNKRILLNNITHMMVNS